MGVTRTISDFLRTKNVRWRWSYLSMRFILDISSSIFVISSVAAYIDKGEGEDFVSDNTDVLIFVFEILKLLGLIQLQLKYELPFLGNQYGLRDGKIHLSFCGMGLEALTEWRNWYILWNFMYGLCFSIRLSADGDSAMIVGIVFDYLFQYILILGWWGVRSLYLKIYELC